VAAVQFHVLLNRPPVVFSPIVAPVLARIVEVRPGAHDGIQSDIAPARKSARRGLAPFAEPDNLSLSSRDLLRGMHATIRLCDATRWRRVVDGRMFDGASGSLPHGDIDWHAERPGHL